MFSQVWMWMWLVHANIEAPNELVNIHLTEHRLLLRWYHPYSSHLIISRPMACLNMSNSAMNLSL